MYTLTHTHAKTQTHSPTHTLLVSVHILKYTLTSYKPDVCAYRSISIHACTHSLPLPHTHPQAHCLPCCSFTLSATCAACGCTCSSAATTSSPAPLIAAQCRGSFPSACAKATTGNVSTLHTQPASKAAKKPCAPACYPL